MPRMDMRIAVMTYRGGLDDRVSVHFGRSPTITLVDVRDGRVEDVRVVENPHIRAPSGHGRMLVGTLLELGVQAVIVGGLGAGALGHLREAGIKVYRAEGMTVREAVERLLRGELEELTEAQWGLGHHGHHHYHH